MLMPIDALAQTDLQRLSTPARGQPEAISDVLFDTQLYTSATTTNLQFFQTQQNDRTLSNLNGSGTLPGGNWFRIFWAGCDILQDAFLSANVDTGAWDDYQKLLLVGRPVAYFTVNGKNYLDGVPLSFLHTSGGAVGMGTGTLTAPAQVQVANNSIPDGGFPMGGLVIGPTIGFSASIQWTAAQTLAAGNPRIRLWFAGVRYRPVV